METLKDFGWTIKSFHIMFNFLIIKSILYNHSKSSEKIIWNSFNLLVLAPGIQIASFAEIVVL